MRGFFDRAQREPVHHLERGRRDAARGDRRHRAGRVRNGRVDGKHRLRRLGLARQPNRDLGYDPHRAFRAHQQARQVTARPIRELGAGVNHATAGKHDFEPQHVVGGDAVGQGVRPARVFRHVAADGAGFLARGVGNEVVTVVRDGKRQVQVHDAGLDPRALVLDIDFNDLLHARE